MYLLKSDEGKLSEREGRKVMGPILFHLGLLDCLFSALIDS